MKQKLVSFLGPPGSGKGTQAGLLARDYGYVHIATGDLFRALRAKVATDSFARVVIDRYDKGIPQPDDVATKLVFEKVEAHKDAPGLILDPYPLSLDQAFTLEAYADQHADEYEKPWLVYFTLSENDAVKRLLLRREKSGRTDDTEDIIRFRYQQYAERTQGIKDFFTKKERILLINGEQSIEDVYQDLVTHMRTLSLLPTS